MSAIDGMVAADELPPLHEEAERLEGLRERRLGVQPGLRLDLVARGGRGRFTGVLREAEHRVGRPRHQRIEGADQVEHRAVRHRALARVGGVEAVQPVLVAQELHDRAALP